MKSVVYTEMAPKAIGPYSQAIKAGNLLFVSGQIGVDPTTGNIMPGGVAEQTKQVLNNIKAILESENLTLKDIVKTTVYLKDLNDFETVNAVYGEYFFEKAPARGCVQVSRLPRDVAVEIEAIAYL